MTHKGKNKATLMQLHHQWVDIKNNHSKTEMMAQRDISTNDELSAFVRETQESHPVPEGAQWLVVQEGSPHFWMTHEDGISVIEGVNNDRANV